MKYGKMQGKNRSKKSYTCDKLHSLKFHKTVICTDRKWGRIPISENYSGVLL